MPVPPFVRRRPDDLVPLGRGDLSHGAVAFPPPPPSAGRRPAHDVHWDVVGPSSAEYLPFFDNDDQQALTASIAFDRGPGEQRALARMLIEIHNRQSELAEMLTKLAEASGYVPGAVAGPVE